MSRSRVCSPRLCARGDQMETEFGLWENLQVRFVREPANLILDCELSCLVCFSCSYFLLEVIC